MLSSQYQDLKDTLLKSVLSGLGYNKNSASLELFISSKCEKNCEYCYLVKHGHDLYPMEINEADILNNIKLILKYFIRNKISIDRLELFSGEIWYTEFGTDVLSIIYEIFTEYGSPVKVILIPTNMSFVLSDTKYLIQEYIDKFREIDVDIIISASIDGEIIDPSNGNGFYNKVFDFCSKNKFGYHPMISSTSIHKWVENYDWFSEMLYMYGQSYDDLMMLEVRDDNWTKDKISLYIEFIEHVWDSIFPESMSFEDKSNILKEWYSFDKYKSYNILQLFGYSDKYNCGIQDRITIRVGDLAIVPCHRTSYDGYEYGYLIKNSDNSRIEGIRAKNSDLAVSIYSSNPCYTNMKCTVCKYNTLCTKQCLGVQLETGTKEIFSCCETVCNLHKSKIDFLAHKYVENGFLDILKYIYNPMAMKTYTSIQEFLGGNNE